MDSFTLVFNAMCDCNISNNQPFSQAKTKSKSTLLTVISYLVNKSMCIGIVVVRSTFSTKIFPHSTRAQTSWVSKRIPAEIRPTTVPR